MEEVLMAGLGMFLFKQGSRNGINNKRMQAPFVANYERSFGLHLPHQDTVAGVLKCLDPKELDGLKMDLMSQQFEQKWLRKHRLLGEYYLVAVDGTGVVSFDHRHCEHCLTKTSKKGKTTYYHYVLEAKLVTPDGYCLSLGSEWIENPSGTFDKQDCERKAFVRLADKLKAQYPRLPICILGDGLYANNTVFDVCQANDWKYIIVLQDGQLKTVQEELVLTRRGKPARESYVVREGWRIGSQYRFQADIPYQKHKLHWIGCTESKKKDVKPGKQASPDAVVSTFEYVTNIVPAGENLIAIAQGGRLRWKVENEGFNTQKNEGYELGHKYCRKSYTGLQNYYTLLQIAHFINQLVEKGKMVAGWLGEHSKQTIRNIWFNLLAYVTMVMPPGHGQNQSEPHPT